MKVPKARKLKSGNWFIQLRLGNESIPVTESTEKACIKQAQLIKAEYLLNDKERKYTTGKDLTLTQAINRYIESRDEILSPATIRGYDIILRHRFQSVMSCKLKSIDNWQTLCNDELKKISPKTLSNAWGLIKSVLKYHEVSIPNITLPQVVKKDLPWIEPDNLEKFLEAINGDPYEVLILLAMHGLRRSEVVNIDISKVDTTKQTITVKGAKVYNKDNKLVEKDTNKNKASQRIVPIIIPRLLDLLKEPIPNCEAGTIGVHVNIACEKIGIPPVGTHGLRRSFASLCYHLKLSERETMELGGWSDANVMRNIYIKLAAKDKENARLKLSEFFMPKVKNANKNANNA